MRSKNDQFHFDFYGKKTLISAIILSRRNFILPEDRVPHETIIAINVVFFVSYYVYEYIYINMCVRVCMCVNMRL